MALAVVVVGEVMKVGMVTVVVRVVAVTPTYEGHSFGMWPDSASGLAMAAAGSAWFADCYF